MGLSRPKPKDGTRACYQWIGEFYNVVKWLHGQIDTTDRDTKQVKISFTFIPKKYRAWDVKPGYPLFLVSPSIHYIAKPAMLEGGWLEKEGFKWDVHAATKWDVMSLGGGNIALDDFPKGAPCQRTHAHPDKDTGRRRWTA